MKNQHIILHKKFDFVQRPTDAVHAETDEEFWARVEAHAQARRIETERAPAEAGQAAQGDEKKDNFGVASKSITSVEGSTNGSERF